MSAPSPARTRTLGHIGATTVAVTILAACSSNAMARPDDARVRQFAAQGYLADDHFGISTSFASWPMAEAALDVVLTVPVGTGPFPLVVYLPGLGETRAAGEAWRTAWAQGGYAVLSLQPLAEDAHPWTDAMVDIDTLRGIARTRYDAQPTAGRLALLATAMTELKRRAAEGEAPYSRIDTDRVALAGFDLGAHTVASLAADPHGALRPRALISISPYVTAGEEGSAPWSGIGLPVLTVTSNHDVDPLGLLPDAGQRRSAFERMPAGDKFMVVMSTLSHRVLGGQQPRSNPLGQDSRDEGLAIIADAKPAGRSRNGRRRNPAGSSPSDRSPTSRAIGQAAIQGVSTAFLDAYVKEEAEAAEWLTTEAGRWLGSRGTLVRK